MFSFYVPLTHVFTLFPKITTTLLEKSHPQISIFFCTCHIYSSIPGLLSFFPLGFFSLCLATGDRKDLLLCKSKLEWKDYSI